MKKYMSINEFADLGLLQEINRQILHPLGLALEVVDRIIGKESYITRIIDNRDDPEGMIFGCSSTELGVKAQRVVKLAEERREVRTRALGYFVQPADGGPNEAMPTLTTPWKAGPFALGPFAEEVLEDELRHDAPFFRLPKGSQEEEP